ncbi:D-isomer specific 2-hydroxyacid dehydrogenase [Amylocarpus encephaloides]|uniref:D-isomer specific 2-hydroxyacid dehydrogenase n=1 Tax=Amylocarpus encephaloides TaxID=45428 RepID=A0A9P7YLJ2_9HELO|nr:D-isomer specific 2-hydroxyacid dehydrogenase [Amylocarpus encephaloides]
MPPVPPKAIEVAVLDDYAGIAATQFETLKSVFEFIEFPDTLSPYNHPDTPESVKHELVQRLQPFTIISTMRERTPFPEALLKRLPNLKLLLTTGTRNLGIDMVAARSHGIVVTGAGGRGRSGPDSTTQHCVALILGIAKNVARDDASVKAGGWQTSLSTGLTGKTLALLGLGRLGVAVGRIMSCAFGMKVIAWSSSLTQETADEKAKAAGLPVENTESEKTFRVVSKEELFKTADVLSIHYVLSGRSLGIVGGNDLRSMKKSALLINTSRGPLVDEDAIIQVLNDGAIRGAAMDVFGIEPLPPNSPWRTTKWGEEGRSQVLLTPHTGYVQEETMKDWYIEQAENLERWHRGEKLYHILN